ncbi:polysaccharide biosynthesis/export family protein [Pleomorphomonas sp. PLEO]|uniref:polysaccharide biosynthesis/export family protein n=1 Tax=Pleomorphomonas sp. PLEO TaxID=3239306 RepID=UPI00351DED21
MRRRAFLGLALLGLGACTALPRRQPADAQPPFPDGLDGPYRLDSGDKLRVTVFEQTALSGTFSIDQSGYIAYPLVGNVVARGLTTQELAGALTRGLKKGYLTNPDVTVEVDTYRPFFIMGEVRNPGQYTYVNTMTIETAIAIAGGFTSRADERRIEVSRRLNGKNYTGILPPSALVRPGDVLKIAQRLF